MARHTVTTLSLTAALALAGTACNLLPFGPSSGAVSGAPLTVLLPLPNAANVRYDSPGSTNNRLDVYLPQNGRAAGAPTILYFHGGGWREGDKSDDIELCRKLADAGYPVVCGNYTLSTWLAPGFPQAVRDCKAIVRWIRTTGALRFQLPTRIIAMGDSAGGHLAEMAGTTAGVSEFEPLPPPPGGYRVDGVVAFFAPADLLLHALTSIDGFSALEFIGASLDDTTLSRYMAASPLTYASAGAPPMALFHGEADPVVPFETAISLERTLVGFCRYCGVFLYPDAGHGFDGFGGFDGAAALTIQTIPTLLADRADLNGDGVVDGVDAQRLVEMLIDPEADAVAHPGCNPFLADFNHDGAVDADDIQFLVTQIIGP